MDDIRFYLSIFMRRLPWFLIVATVITAIAGTLAVTLPPAYVSQMRLIVESPQIPSNLAVSTVQTPALEQLQIIEQRLLTRANLLDIARRLDVLPDIAEMSPDEIVSAMRSRTTVRTNTGRNAATIMTVSFEAAEPRKAAGVMGEYLTIIQEADAEFRRGRAGDTLQFFSQEVDRLAQALSEQSAKMLAYKEEHADASPQSLNFRMSQHADLKNQMLAVDGNIRQLENQRDRLLQLYQATGQVGTTGPAAQALTPDQQQLQQLEAQLSTLLVTFSDENPKVKLLRTRIANLEEKIAADEAARAADDAAAKDDADPVALSTGSSLLDFQLSDINGQIKVLQERKVALQSQIEDLEDTIDRTPAVTIQIDEMQRAYDLIDAQYKAAENRLAQAQTGDLIEARSRGQRISVIEQPNVPTEPSRPNRVKIAGLGGALGIAAGLGLVVLLEMLNSAARRPEDLVKRFGIQPFTTIPYMRTRRQIILQRSAKALVILVILIGIPAAIYAVHLYYLPMDLLAEKVMNKLGVRL